MRDATRATALLRWTTAAALALLILSAPGPASAVSVGLELLVTVNGSNGQIAYGGPDASTDTPLSLQVSPGDSVEVKVTIDFGVPIREYQTTIFSDDPASLDYLGGSANDLSTLGFSLTGDPDDTLQDASPETGAGSSALCPSPACTAPSTNSFYELAWIVAPVLPADLLRDITIQIDSIQFDGAHTLDAQRDTASIVLLLPEPATGLLLVLGFALVLWLREARRA